MEYALTDAQMTFYSGLVSEENAMWNQGICVLFSEKYSLSKVNDALNFIVENCDQLRVRIKRHADKPYAYITPFRKEEYPLMVFRSKEELMEAAQNFVNKPMDILGSLFRCAIVEVCGQAGVLICAHHILIDGYSVQVMLRVLESYLREGMSPEPIGENYEEHLAGICEYTQTKRYHRDHDYWKTQLERQSRQKIFSYDVPDPTSSEWESQVPAELFRKIRSFCQCHGISVSAFFCTALSACLQRETGFMEFPIGIPVQNRTTRAELSSIGLYMHILPLMMELTGDSFLENARRTEYAKMDLFRHERMTQSQIQAILKEAGAGDEALFEVVFDYQSFEYTTEGEATLHYSNVLSVPLEIHLHSFPDDLHKVKIRYRECVFSAEQISSIWHRVITVVENALKAPDTGLLQIKQYLPQETHLLDLNNTDFQYDVPDNFTIMDIFEKTAQEHDGDICLYAGMSKVTYGEFLHYVQELDGRIRELTKNKKTVVAICAERSVEMYAAIYAVMRGGNTYLPISTNDPKDRIEYVLRDSGAAVVLAQDRFLPLVGSHSCINLTRFMENLPGTESLLPIAANLDDTAYVIYTSGSTGLPKGACVSHRSLLNRILWMQEAYDLKPGNVILQKTPYTFDVSLWEIFWWGICGASMAASAPNEHFLPAKILKAVEKYGISHLHFVPSVLELYLSFLEDIGYQYSSDCTIEHVFTSGEALSAEQVRRFYQIFPYPNVALHNLYGPTECAVDVSFYDCLPTDQDPIPIGRPIYNTQLYVVDEQLELVPQGVRGQLCIAGQNVGLGYLNRPELTTQRFVENPFGPGKLYLTGDYAKIDKSGQILFCGRMDDQIKLNGQRIEIGEIEKVILNLEGIESVAVVLYENNGQKLLGAAFCSDRVSVAVVKAHCEKHLPFHMIPSVFVPVAAMPLNSSGKLDRKAIIRLAESCLRENGDELPETETEKIVADVFCKILGRDQVGRHDSFFALGGSSLSMIRALSEQPLQGITSSEFIENSTPYKLALRLENCESRTKTYVQCLRLGETGGTALVLLPYAGGSAEGFASFTQAVGRLWPACSVYYIDYPKDIVDCEAAAAELKVLAEHKKLYLYSHCAGSAAALQILNILEGSGTSVIDGYIAGASIPPAVPSTENFWHGVSDEMLKAVLQKAGASFEALSEQHISRMLTQFRKDTDFWTSYFVKEPLRVSCAVTLVLSKQDLFTENYTDAATLWGRYAKNIAQIHYIDTESHYFQSAQSEELLRILMKVVQGE